MPIDTFWTVRDLMSECDYGFSDGASTGELNDVFKKIFKKLAPFAIYENDRVWLYKKAGITTAGGS